VLASWVSKIVINFLSLVIAASVIIHLQ